MYMYKYIYIYIYICIEREGERERDITGKDPGVRSAQRHDSFEQGMLHYKLEQATTAGHAICMTWYDFADSASAHLITSQGFYFRTSHLKTITGPSTHQRTVGVQTNQAPIHSKANEIRHPTKEKTPRWGLGLRM